MVFRKESDPKGNSVLHRILQPGEAWAEIFPKARNLQLQRASEHQILPVGAEVPPGPTPAARARKPATRGPRWGVSDVRRPRSPHGKRGREAAAPAPILSSASAPPPRPPGLETSTRPAATLLPAAPHPGHALGLGAWPRPASSPQPRPPLLRLADTAPASPRLRGPKALRLPRLHPSTLPAGPQPPQHFPPPGPRPLRPAGRSPVTPLARVSGHGLQPRTLSPSPHALSGPYPPANRCTSVSLWVILSPACPPGAEAGRGSGQPRRPEASVPV